MTLANEQQLLSAVSLTLPAVSRLLVIAPHPDDEVFGCGATLARLRAQGCAIHVVVVTDGAQGGADEAGALTRRRAAESCAAAAVLGLPPPEFWNLPDRGLIYGEPLIARLMAAMEAVGADGVLLPSPVDWNPDHQTLAFAGAEALRRLGGQRLALFYEVTDPLPAPNLLHDISDTLALKQQAMRCFASQLDEQPYVERINGLNRLRATHLGPTVQAAEAFLQVTASALDQGLRHLLEGPLTLRHARGFAADAGDLPLVSVIVRSMDRPTLDEALDSVALQTWPHIEVVLVNAKGPEHRPMPSTWGRLPLRVVATDAPVGRTRAANLGLEAARGAYLMFLDDDDWFDAGHVAKLVEALRRQPGFRVAYTGTRSVDAQGRPLPEVFTTAYDEVLLQACNLTPIHAVLFCQTLVAQGCRFDEDFDLYEDWDFWLQLSCHGAFLQVEGCSAVYRINRQSGSGVHAADDTVRNATLAIFRKWFARMSDERHMELAEAVKQNRMRGQRLEAQDRLLADKDGQLQHLGLALGERDDQLIMLKQQLDETRSALDETRSALNETRKALELSQQQRAQATQATQSLEARLTQTQQEMAHILNSHSFRLTRPLRLLRRRAQQTQHVIQLTQRYVDQRGGWVRGMPQLVARSWEILARGGLGGFAGRLRDYARFSAHASPAGVAPMGTGHLVHLPTSAGQLPDVPPVDYRFWKSYALPCPVDIVVCVHNALEDVARCLSSVLQHSAHCRLILVDDGSRDDTRDYLRTFASDQGATLLRNETAGGYTRAANQGLRASSGGYVILLNSDTIVSPGWVEKLVACAESDPAIGLVGPLSNTASWQSIPCLMDADGDWSDNPLPAGMSVAGMSGLVAKHAAHGYPRMAFLNGFCLMLRRALIDEIGIFDEAAFGRGYGEENDYCLRARAAGWSLALADNAYVFHAQSKSYSHEKRKQLAEHAGQQLAAKHGTAPIIAGVEQCRWDRRLQSIRAQARAMLEREALLTEARAQWEGHRVLFVLPIMHAGGGGNVVITEARAMMRMGVDVTLANLSVHRRTFEQSHAGLDVPVVYVDTAEEIPALGRDFDAVVATAFHSVAWLEPLATLPDGPVLGYYVQDFEPLFFAPGSHNHDEALRSYTLIPELRLFTKTAWNRDMVQQHTGQSATLVGPSYDMDLFRPRLPDVGGVGVAAPVRLVAMVRPSTPRRNPEGTLRVLARLQQRFGAKVEIAVFGNEEAGLPLPAGAEGLQLLNHGHLRAGQTAMLLSDADIFIDMSHYQAMGLTAMEAMACGAIPVVPREGGATSFARHDENALIVDTQDESAVVAAVAELIEDAARRRRLQAAAIDSIAQYAPERSAAAILHCLFAKQPRP